jgi:hypothetical protein
MKNINRSHFLKRLITLAGLGQLSFNQVQTYRKLYLFQCFISGFRFHKGKELLSLMAVGDLLELRREPENQYDAFAVALYWQAKKVGYLPAANNEMIARLLDTQAIPLRASITHIKKAVAPWENVAIDIYFLQAEGKTLPAHTAYLTQPEDPTYQSGKMSREMRKLLPDVIE